jgi:hypothetical protein
MATPRHGFGIVAAYAPREVRASVRPSERSIEMRHLPIAMAALATCWVTPALACAVPGQLALTNGTGQILREAILAEQEAAPASSAGRNALPPEGLAPGATQTIVLPDCMGRYVLTVLFADGTRRELRSIHGIRTRAIELR